VCNEGLGDGTAALCDGPWGVDVIDAQLPLSVMVSRIEEAG
jgi:hypothetical protein